MRAPWKKITVTTVDISFDLPGLVLQKTGPATAFVGDTLEYRFQIQNKGSVVPASYTGIVPDTFKDGSEVVLKGHLVPGGFAVEANGVMAKCPSKYVAGQSGQPGS